MIGLVILCNNKPNRVHYRLSGDRILGAVNAARPKAKEKTIADFQMPCPDNSGKSAIRKKPPRKLDQMLGRMNQRHPTLNFLTFTVLNKFV